MTIATWLLWHSSSYTIETQLGQNLDATFNDQFGRVLVSKNGDSKRDSAFFTLLEGDGDEAVTVISTYAAIILANPLVLTLIATVVSEIARRQGWKCYNVDVNCLERNKLFCQIYNKSRLSGDENCLEDAKDFVLVATSEETGKKMRISVENRNEIHLVPKMQADDYVV